MKYKVLFALAFVVLCLPFTVMHINCGALVAAVLKVLPCMLLLFALLKAGKDSASVIFAATALCFSMAGDIAGEIEGEYSLFVMIGLFAISQIIYSVSFARHFDMTPRKSPGYAVRIALLAIVIIYAFTYGSMLVSHVGGSMLKVFVIVYLILISCMALSSVCQARPGLALYVLGALLFLVSDSVLAYRIFVGRIPHAGLYIMSTYYAAQYFLNVNIINRNE